MVAYTDGVIEAQNPEQEEFGQDRLQQIVRNSLSLSAARICEQIQDGLRSFMGGSPQPDDITLVVLKVKLESDETSLSFH